jgi:hypothetical protein
LFKVQKKAGAKSVFQISTGHKGARFLCAYCRDMEDPQDGRKGSPLDDIAHARFIVVFSLQRALNCVIPLSSTAFFVVVLVGAEAALPLRFAAAFVAGLAGDVVFDFACVEFVSDLTSFALPASTLLPPWSQDASTSRAMTIKTDLPITEECISPASFLRYVFSSDLPMVE